MIKECILLLLLNIILGTTNSQVLKTQVQFDNSEVEIFIGPKNVNPIYPSQTKEYIEKYERKVEELNVSVNEFEQEIKSLEKKKIKNSRERDKYKRLIEYNLEKIFLIENLIIEWEEYNSKFEKYSKLVDSLNLDNQPCFNVILENDTLNFNEFSMLKVKNSKRVSYEEFIDSLFILITGEHSREQINKRAKYGRILYIDFYDEDIDYIISSDTFSIQETINSIETRVQNRKKEREKLIANQKDKHISNNFSAENEIEKRVSQLFSDFTFDRESFEFYRELEMNLDDINFLFFDRKNKKQIFPLSFEIKECEK